MRELRRSATTSSVALLIGGVLIGIGLTLATLLALGQLSKSEQAVQEERDSRQAVTTESIDQPTTPSTTAPTTTIPSDQIFVSEQGVDEPGRGRQEDSPVRTSAYAIAMANPGDTVHFAKGIYEPLIVENKNGLTVVGDTTALPLFTAAGYGTGPGILIRNSSQIDLVGVRVEQSLWGIVIAESTDIAVFDSEIVDVGQEGFLIGENSHRIEISGNLVTRTGQRPGSNGKTDFSDFGEGIYLGTGGVLADGSYDQSTEIFIHDNEISFTTAEAIDVKPSVVGVEISNNTIHDIATANSGAIVISIGPRVSPDPMVLIEGNSIYRITRTSPWKDGNAIVLSAPAIVRNNVIWDVQHYGIYVDANFVSGTPAQLLITNNLIFSTGLSPIEDVSQNLDAPVEIFIAENLTGVDAQVLVADLDQEASEEEFIMLLFGILDASG